MADSKRLLEDFHVLYTLSRGQRVTTEEIKAMERTPPLPLDDSSNIYGTEALLCHSAQTMAQGFLCRTIPEKALK